LIAIDHLLLEENAVLLVGSGAALIATPSDIKSDGIAKDAVAGIILPTGRYNTRIEDVFARG
jgi:hypothetical protein